MRQADPDLESTPGFTIQGRESLLLQVYKKNRIADEMLRYMRNFTLNQLVGWVRSNE
jgi:hypothetical protein